MITHNSTNRRKDFIETSMDSLPSVSPNTYPRNQNEDRKVSDEYLVRNDFEPIAFVTPAKKRARIDPQCNGNYGSINDPPSRSSYYNAERRISIGSTFITPPTGSPLSHSSPSQYMAIMSQPFSPEKVYFNPETNVIETFTPTSSHLSNQSSMFDTFQSSQSVGFFSGGPLAEASRNDYDFNDSCPDLNASMSSFAEGGLIIQTTDSFKENSCSKAEIVRCDPNLLSHSTIENVSSITTPLLQRIISSDSERGEDKEKSTRFKPFHEAKWVSHYQELLEYKEVNGDCLVPHTYPSKPHLARWVKRQRRQYKIRMEGQNSTMTEERIQNLNEIGFVWDSHEVIWKERFNQLIEYKKRLGHCMVPSYCKDCPQLASWVKCQRRQYKLFWEHGKGSSMNLDRISQLDSIGFVWEVNPTHKKRKAPPGQDYQHLANILLYS